MTHETDAYSGFLDSDLFASPTFIAAAVIALPIVGRDPMTNPGFIAADAAASSVPR